jgi:alkanesulfonate monooxygenase SsuD/methylene tetrahydromethanopterin reductase-like flavin-dependent oxidoreductase (luciferase family)
MTHVEQIHFGVYISRSPKEEIGASCFVDQIFAYLDDVHRYMDSAWFSDHFVGSPQNPDYPSFEAWTTISYVAHAYPNLHFGHVVLSQSYRNPALLAKMGATLQALSGGRFILGIGAGWWEEEYLAYGYPFPRASVRIQQLAEAIQLIRAMWTEPRATFEGKHYHVRDAICEPKPQPRPPIMIGGRGEQLTLRVMAQHADWCNFPPLSLETYAHKLNVLRGHCEAVGRAYDEIVKTACLIIAVGQSEDEARRILAASTFTDTPALVGTPDQVAEQLQAYVDLGATHLLCGFADFPQSAGARLFAEEVIPRFRLDLR